MMNEIYKYCEKHFKKFSDKQFRFGKTGCIQFGQPCGVTITSSKFGKDEVLFEEGIKGLKLTVQYHLRAEKETDSSLIKDIDFSLRRISNQIKKLDRRMKNGY